MGRRGIWDLSLGFLLSCLRYVLPSRMWGVCSYNGGLAGWERMWCVIWVLLRYSTLPIYLTQ